MVSELENNEQEEGINFAEIGQLFLSRWYWFVGAVLITLSVAVFYIMKTTPIYTRSTQLLIKDDDKSASNSIMKDFQDMGLFAAKNNIKNEILTLKAPVKMEQVVKRLHLDLGMTMKQGLKTVSLYNNAPVKVEFAGELSDASFVTFKLKLKSKTEASITDLQYGNEEPSATVFPVTIDGAFVKTPVASVKVTATAAWDDEMIGKVITVTKRPVCDVAAAYNGALKVALSEKEATVVNLSISDDVPARADDILLTLIEVYNENWVTEKNRIAESTNEFINERLAAITKELGDVDSDISEFKSKNMMPDMKASLAKDYQQSSTNYNTLLELNNQLSMTKFINQHLADKTKDDQLLPTNVGLPSPGIERMIADYNQMMMERTTILMNSNAQSPMVLDLDRRLASQKNAIHRSLENLAEQLKKQIANIEKSERDINAQIATAPRHVKKLQSVERQQKVKEALYIFLLQKREENELSKTYTAYNTSIIQPPTGSKAPTSPKKPMILLVALVMGLAIPGGILFLGETMNTRVRGRKDLDGMETPLVGEIPNLNGKRHWWQKNRQQEREIVVEENSRNIVNESFRVVRTKLDYFTNLKQTRGNVIMITSFNPGSGKSFIAANLAKTYGLKGKKVLAIDMDLRHCSMSYMLENKTKSGLSSFLSNTENDIHKLIVKNAFGENVDVLPVGVTPPNPSELLYNEKLDALFETLKEEYDIIFMDCPPIEIVADASIVGKYADVSLFVIRAGLMDRRALKDVDKLYKENKYNHLAILLNGTDFVGGKYGHYRYGYRYGYGYGAGYGASAHYYEQK